MIDKLEVSLTVSPIDATNPEVSTVAVDGNSYKDIMEGSKIIKINECSKIHNHIKRY